MASELYRLAGVGEVCADVRTNYVCPFHTHDTYSIGIFKGPARIVCRGGAWEVDDGDIVLLEPNEPHRGTPLSSTCTQDGVFPEPAFMTRMFGSATPFIFPQHIVRDPVLAGKLSRAAAGRRGHDMRALLRRLFMLYGCPRRPGDEDGPLGETAFCADLDAGVAAASRAQGMSRWRFGRRLRALTGLSPRDMRRQLRVARARALIENGEELASAALRSGFSDQAHMTRQLRSLLGVTPSALREGRGDG